MLQTDYRTLINCKRLINVAKDNKKLEEVLEIEGRGLLATWLDEGFGDKLKIYMKTLSQKKS